MQEIALLADIANLVQSLMISLGYPGIFILMVLEGTLLPIPSEVVMAFGGYLAFSGGLQPFDGIPAYIILLISGTVGNTVGAYLAYAIGRYGGIPIILKYGRYVLLDQKSVDRTHAWFLKYGPVSVFFTRLVPIFRTFISIPAGIAKMKLTSFLGLTFLGSLLWDALLIYFGYSLGPNWNQIIADFDKYTYIAIAIAAALIVFWLIQKIRERKSQALGTKRDAK
ncbi:MAG: DedA family protein [Thermoplasmataceae archaeon]